MAATLQFQRNLLEIFRDKKTKKKTNKKKNLVKTDWHMPKSSALM